MVIGLVSNIYMECICKMQLVTVIVCCRVE